MLLFLGFFYCDLNFRSWSLTLEKWLHLEALFSCGVARLMDWTLVAIASASGASAGARIFAG